MKNKGVSLIVLIITIVVIIILAAAVILAISNNNPIGNSRVASITQTRDSLQSGILVYAGDVSAKTLGNYSTKQILIENSNYNVVTSDVKQIVKDGEAIEIYQLDKDKLKTTLHLDVKENWYIDSYGIVYLIYDEMSNVPTYYKENNAILSSLSNFVIVANSNVYQITYDTNGGNPIQNQIKAENGSVTLRTPTKTNQTFLYWKDSANNHYEAGATYTDNESISLTAVWGCSASNIAAMSDAEKQGIIGKSVELTSTNGWTDWKVFGSDGTNIMLIAGDYVDIRSTAGYIPTSAFGTNKLGVGAYNTTYCVNSNSKENLLNSLVSASIFNEFKDSAGKVTEARIPTIDDFTKSYNAVSHSGQTYTDETYPSGYPEIQKIYYKNNGVNGGLNVASGSSTITSSDNVPNDSYGTGYGLPRNEDYYGQLWVMNDNAKAYGYWISSASSESNNSVMYINRHRYCNL